MGRRQLAYWLICAATAATGARANAAGLTIAITGLEEPTGRVAIAVFDNADDYAARTEPLASARVPVTSASVVWETSASSTTGRLAVMVYHDVNGNGELDLGRLGVPREPYGFSNDARGLFGPPGFEDASFEATDASRLEIRLR